MTSAAGIGLRAWCLPALLCAACAAPGTAPDGPRFPPLIHPQGVARSNVELAEDFLDYTFALETGEVLAGILRYEEPVRIHFTSPGLDPYRDEIDVLLARIRREAEVDIRQVRHARDALIVVEAVPRAELERIYPTAACFIVPGVTSWRSFLARRPRERLSWSGLRTLGRAAIFVPLDTTPQDVRDCLNEEITQALGPANDLYRVADSIWNDDNMHAVPTPFNMLMLRLLYQPEIRSGMDREAVARLLPGLLDRLNPQGRALAPRPRHPESRAWASAIELALNRRAPPPVRLGAARAAVEAARAMEPVDHRLAVALLALGRQTVRRDPQAAAEQFAEAYALSRQLHGNDDIRTAHAALHVAVLALATGHAETARGLAAAHAPAAFAGRNAVLLAGLRAVEAEALAALGRAAEARAARLDSLGWARYGLGDADGAIAREEAEILAARPLASE